MKKTTLKGLLLKANIYGLNNSDLKYSGKDWLKRTLEKYGE